MSQPQAAAAGVRDELTTWSPLPSAFPATTSRCKPLASSLSASASDMVVSCPRYTDAWFCRPRAAYTIDHVDRAGSQELEAVLATASLYEHDREKSKDNLRQVAVHGDFTCPGTLMMSKATWDYCSNSMCLTRNFKGGNAKTKQHMDN